MLRHSYLISLAIILLLCLLPTNGGASQAVQAETTIYIPLVVRPVTYDASSGIPDEDFDGDGVVSSDFPPGMDNILQALALQEDGKIVAAGYVFNGVDDDFALARYNPDGSLDAELAGAGWLVTDVNGNGSDDEVRAVVVQEDGKIVVAGVSDDGEDFDFALARYNVDGSLDEAFGGDGLVVSDFYGWHDSAYALALQEDGKLLAAGYTYQDTHGDLVLVRYNPDGSLDTTFAGVGWVSMDFAGEMDQANGVVVQKDGKIVVVGEAEIGVDGSDIVVARFNPDGSLDADFDGDGWLLTDLAGKFDIGKALVIQPDGKVVVSGDSSGDMVVVRYNADGTLDTTFSEDGWLALDFYTLRSANNALILQPDGMLVLAGTAHFCDENDFAMARLTASGNLDRSFEGDGMLLSYIVDINDYGTSLLQQPDGKLVVGGYINNGSDEDFLLARFR